MNTGASGGLKDPLIGRVVEGRYQICRAIGKGGMGVVYEAQHLLMGRKVALKTLAAHASVSPACVKRFRREATAAASVGNSHVVDVLDMGSLDGASFYIVLEHLDGVDLNYAVAMEGRFPVARAIHVLLQLCDAVGAVHAAGIVHRDLKPENIFLIVRDGEPDFVKVLDFGICKFNDPEDGRLTQSGETVGTPLFMSPEQVEARSDIDHRTDIYALGAVLYFLLTGEPPFQGGLPQLLLKICRDPVPPVSAIDGSLPSALDTVIQRALAKDPNHRFSSCGALKEALLPHATPLDAPELRQKHRVLPDTYSPTMVSQPAADDGDAAEWPSSVPRLGRLRASRIAVTSVVTVGVAAAAIYLVRGHRNEPPPSSLTPPVVVNREFVPLPPSVPTAEPPAAVAINSPPESIGAGSSKMRASQNVPSAPPTPVPSTAPGPISNAPAPVGSGSMPPAPENTAAPESPIPARALDDIHLNKHPKYGL